MIYELEVNEKIQKLFKKIKKKVNYILRL